MFSAGGTAWSIACYSQRLRHALNVPPVPNPLGGRVVGLEEEGLLGHRECQAASVSLHVKGVDGAALGPILTAT